jgi:hypothetical protein
MHAVEVPSVDSEAAAGAAQNDGNAPTVLDAVLVEWVGCGFLRQWPRARRLGGT